MVEVPFADDCDILLVTGQRLAGALRQTESGWWQLTTAAGDVLLNPDHLVAVAGRGALDGLPPAGGAAAPPTTRPTRRTGSPGRPWQDDDLRMLANAFLDGVVDKELAQEFGRTQAVIKQLRQGFECARGNVDDDQITEIAASWVHRWRKVLAGD